MNPWGVSAPPLTESEFFNAARTTTFLLVEGFADVMFWEARIDNRRCKVRPMLGRKQALEELDFALVEGRQGILAVLDADFDRVDGVLQVRPDVVWTDLHDLDVLLIASPALEKVLAEVASREKLIRFEATERCTLRDALVSRAIELARLRWLSRRDGLRLSFRKRRADGKLDRVKYHDFCSAQHWTVNLEAMVRAVLNFSASSSEFVGEFGFG